MGIFDDVAGAVGASGGDIEMTDAIGGLIGEGGMQGLVEKFKKSGFGDTVGSWIDAGSNLPISAEQIQSVLGNEKVASIARKLGISTEEASRVLASLLPQAIDKLTPNGKLPDAGTATERLGGNPIGKLTDGGAAPVNPGENPIGKLQDDGAATDRLGGLPDGKLRDGEGATERPDGTPDDKLRDGGGATERPGGSLKGLGL